MPCIRDVAGHYRTRASLTPAGGETWSTSTSSVSSLRASGSGPRPPRASSARATRWPRNPPPPVIIYPHARARLPGHFRSFAATRYHRCFGRARAIPATAPGRDSAMLFAEWYFRFHLTVCLPAIRIARAIAAQPGNFVRAGGVRWHPQSFAAQGTRRNPGQAPLHVPARVLARAASRHCTPVSAGASVQSTARTAARHCAGQRARGDRPDLPFHLARGPVARRSRGVGRIDRGAGRRRRRARDFGASRSKTNCARTASAPRRSACSACRLSRSTANCSGASMRPAWSPTT